MASRSNGRLPNRIYVGRKSSVSFHYPFLSQVTKIENEDCLTKVSLPGYGLSSLVYPVAPFTATFLVPVDEYEYGYEYEEEEINIPRQPTGKRRSCHLIYRSTGGIFPVAVAVQ